MTVMMLQSVIVMTMLMMMFSFMMKMLPLLLLLLLFNISTISTPSPYSDIHFNSNPKYSRLHYTLRLDVVGARVCMHVYI